MNNSDDLRSLNSELNVVYRYLRKLKISHEDAEDIVQETAYKFLQYYDSIRNKKIRSWLIRVALNFHYDQTRKNSRVKLDLREDQVKTLSKDLPEEILLSHEKWSEIEYILSKLKPTYRELLLLKYIWELKYDEIAEILDLKANNIKTSLFRARKEFAKLYKEVYR
ncbi:sigma-70 family RNA polymerase sigma factor [Niallia circulans]|uniref:Sigma-70 family RNA polymerase sigma factor n=1 Tax=Niallia circulans TaxID=1397 RepID=A0A553SRN7_NIACI|nr:sigma-70 family RNA polymerase sigma factor [Niallia circulans]TRZ39628.1 sigma-70 family RNA polymerase sigma factor [Niallia circulans]